LTGAAQTHLALELPPRAEQFALQRAMRVE
jgi:hypothetical protein